MSRFKNSFKESEGNFFVKRDTFINLYKLDENNEDYRFLNDKEWLGVFDLMELVSRTSLIEPGCLDRNLKIADFIEVMMGNTEKHFFTSNLRMMIMKNFMDSRPTEFDIHEKFEKEYKSVLGNDYEIVKLKSNPKHIPDFWIKHDNVLIPVEIKLHDFNSSHLRQLKRYMDFYNCGRGIAVGGELNCPLPSNVTFVCHKDM